MNTAIFYASSTGNTEAIAKEISKKLNNIKLYNICDDGIEKISNYDKLIFGTPTWGEGDLQDDWEDVWNDFSKLDFTNKTVALFGLGDQDSYGDEFVNALGTMYETIKENGAKVIGFTSTEGYEYDESTAEIDNNFVGLVIDEDNQEELTDERIDSWIETIEKDIL